MKVSPTPPDNTREPTRMNETSVPKASTSNAGIKSFCSPFDFRGSAKAGPRKTGGRASRYKGKSMIAKDTPNKTDKCEKKGFTK